MTNLDNFKPIPGYNNYLVSENGEVYSKKRNKLLSPGDNGRGYLYVVLCKNGKCKNFKVHRLVAMTYIPNPENLPQINHINGVKTDNRVENLEWVSASQNLKHAFDNGLCENTRQNCKNVGKIYGKINGKITGKITGKINIKYAQKARIRHLDENLQNLFDDIFINKLKNKDVCQKYNLNHAYVSLIKNKKFLKVALNEYFGDLNHE